MWPGVRSRWCPSPCLPLRLVQGAQPRAGAGVAEMTPSWLGSGPQTLDSGVDLDPQTQAVEAWLPVHQFDGESRSFGNANRVSPRRAGGPRAQLDGVAARRFLCQERGACPSRFSLWFWRGAARTLNQTRLGANLSDEQPSGSADRPLPCLRLLACGVGTRSFTAEPARWGVALG